MNTELLMRLSQAGFKLIAKRENQELNRNYILKNDIADLTLLVKCVFLLDSEFSMNDWRNRNESIKITESSGIPIISPMYIEGIGDFFIDANSNCLYEFYPYIDGECFTWDYALNDLQKDRILRFFKNYHSFLSKSDVNWPSISEKSDYYSRCLNYLDADSINFQSLFFRKDDNFEFIKSNWLKFLDIRRALLFEWLQWVNQKPRTRAWVHTDIHKGNFILSNNKTSLVDIDSFKSSLWEIEFFLAVFRLGKMKEEDIQTWDNDFLKDLYVNIKPWAGVSFNDAFFSKLKLFFAIHEIEQYLYMSKLQLWQLRPGIGFYPLIHFILTYGS